MLQLKGWGGQVRFDHLATLMKTLVILPYDQAKNDKKFRASLSAETLYSLLYCKINVDCEYHQLYNEDHRPVIGDLNVWRGNTYDNGYNVVCTGNQLSEMVNKLYIMFVMFFTSLFSIIKFDCFFEKKSSVFFLQEEEDLLLFIGKMLEGLRYAVSLLC